MAEIKQILMENECLKAEIKAWRKKYADLKVEYESLLKLDNSLKF